MGSVRRAADEDDPLRRWETVVERAIRDAQERGDFDNLPGHGKPLRLEENPFAGDRELGFRLLKNADVLPVWMELERDIGRERAALDALRERSERRCRGAEPVQGADDQGRRSPSGTALRGGRLAAVGRWLIGAKGEPGGGDRGRGSARASPTGPGDDADRQRARGAYLAAAARLDAKIGAYNEELPAELRWRQRPRLTEAAAGRAFDAACPSVGSEPRPSRPRP